MKYFSLVLSLMYIFTCSRVGFCQDTLQLQLGGDLRGLSPSNKSKFSFSSGALDYRGIHAQAEVKTRGQNCLSAERKCFTVNLKEPLADFGNQLVLVSLSGDHGYINYVTGLKFMERVGLSFIKYRYVHLMINAKSYGLYLLLENPKHALKTRKNAVFIGRRMHWLKRPEAQYWDKDAAPFSKEAYQEAYVALSKNARKLKGPAKHAYLQEHMNIDSYFTWLAVNTLLQNGDYDDELFYYVTKPKNRSGAAIYFEFMGWDYEDLFSKPHFVNRMVHPFAIKKTLLYSLVNRMDNAIFRDPYEYQLFQNHLRELLRTKFNPQQVAAIFQEVSNEISPFLAHDLLAVSSQDPRVPVVRDSRGIVSLLSGRAQQVVDRAQQLWIATELRHPR